jgi:hypothetical protein
MTPDRAAALRIPLGSVPASADTEPFRSPSPSPRTPLMFRRSGSFAAYYVEGKLPDPTSPIFTESLEKLRFRTIENAASEESSIGWVTAGDPTGDTFEQEDIDLDRAVWLRVRFDKKKLPAVWLSIHRTEAERSAGRKLSARERKDLKEDLQSKLLPRVLPSVALVDVLYVPQESMVYLFGTSAAVREEFTKLFFQTFAARLIPADAYEIACRAGLGRDARNYLEEVAPVRWMRDEAPVFGPKPGVRPHA